METKAKRAAELIGPADAGLAKRLIQAGHFPVTAEMTQAVCDMARDVAKDEDLAPDTRIRAGALVVAMVKSNQVDEQRPDPDEDGRPRVPQVAISHPEDQDYLLWRHSQARKRLEQQGGLSSDPEQTGRDTGQSGAPEGNTDG